MSCRHWPLEFNLEVPQSYLAQRFVQGSPNKAFECARYAHRTASQLRRATAAQLCR